MSRFAAVTALFIVWCEFTTAAPQVVSFKIFPEEYLVNERRFSSLPEAIAFALNQKPEEIYVAACSAMRTQRVIDAIQEQAGREDF